MKNEFYGFRVLIAFVFILLIFASPALAATFNSGSTGTLGNVVITANTVIPLPANGMLDYSSLTINSGATLTFTANSNNTPVYILAKGDVTINGAINVSGGNASGMTGGAPGPGGWAGGNGAQMGKTGEPGRGPGGGGGGLSGTMTGGGGSFGSSGYQGGGLPGATYGSDNHMPLLGGSGGGGESGSGSTGGSGGGGGGAILIAASGTITINGAIYANGGGASSGGNPVGGAGGGGSGGAIHLLATTITGNGTLQANGAWWGGGGGRIRLEAYYYTRSSGAPSSPVSVITYTPYWMFPGNNPNEANPTLTIVSVNGVTPNFSHFNGDPDILFSASTSPTVTIVVQATGIPDGTNVTVTAKPNAGGSAYTSATAALANGTATVQLTLNTGSKSTLGVSTAAYTLTSSNGAPLYLQGEKVAKMKVAANKDGSSTVTYITASGREITKVM